MNSALQFEGRRRSSGVLNLTPLIDVVFLLLIFFMLTAQFTAERVLPIDLPTAAGAPITAAPEPPLEVTLLTEVAVQLAGEPIAGGVAALFEPLQRALALSRSKALQLRGDRSVSLATLVQVLEMAQRAGAQRVDVVTVAH